MDFQSTGRRKRPRPSYSCVECTRRKLRCSKHIPCSACVERGIAQLCRRRPGVASATVRRPSPASATPIPIRQNIISNEPYYATPALETPRESGPEAIPEDQPRVTVPASTPATSNAPSSNGPARSRHKIVDNVTEDAAVMLEFLALGRQRILQVAQIEQQSPLGAALDDMGNASGLLFTPSQVRSMMHYHQESIAWIHNVVHMPTFREQCEKSFANPSECQGLWLGLYYAMLAVTLYHMSPSLLRDLDIHEPYSLAELCYRNSIDRLSDADYMSNHSLFSLQTICLLIYIGHNIGQSDRISVLLACAVRIAQCLCLHRLGPDPPRNGSTDDEVEAMQRRLIDREVSKRVWWFLVRQDWLQIPFNNTYTIHPTQFNTPMPLNCNEEIPLMFSTEAIIHHEQEHYTQGSYTMVLNDVAVLIWKTQDKMCQQGHPNGVEDGLRKLYSEVLQADRELRELMNKMPSFYRNTPDAQTGHPAHVQHQGKVLSLALAHKFYSIHRHFQIPSFKDPWFAYTKLSCFPIMRRSLATVLSLPPHDPHTSVARNMWTINTHVLTTAVWLLFELIFSHGTGAPNMVDGQETEIRDLAAKASIFLQENQSRSRIAKRGVSLINALLEIDRGIQMGDERQFNLNDIIAHVAGTDQQETQGNGVFGDEPCEQVEGGARSIVDWLSRDAPTWEDILDVLDNASES
ncbi:putative C6 transcription factor [Aspergillus pseudoustus]|uniref:C6 transcription factor n=1 Tax=Aspergillus pseudoustus TaxID=1810923 RepID=A0ABR4IZM6_9EURO